ncbi:MAG: LacI family DNA-binding transcriptional regulator [Alphaproteobacteria bacterium]|nr:LacI family DNA-binding transcriptional regulator [Alphaproteobacteria bacterium]
METRKRNLPTLEDVANAAGVSTATVSRCLNEPDKVSGGTRERVMEAVDKLHYSPNFGARAIAANRTGIVGAVIPTMVNAIFARGVEAFQKTIVANKKTMLVASSSYDRTQEIDQIRTMVARGAEGMLLIGTDRDPEVYAFLSQRNIPVVIAWARTSDPNQSFVGFSNKDASRLLAERAIALGHRSFGYISAYTAMNDRARYRVIGAREALTNAGLDPDAMHLIETKYSLKCARAAFHQMLKANPRPSIIMCGNDVLAVGAIQAAQEEGLHVPDDISITGYDDIELSTVIEPAVTTVHVPHRKMGRLAAETLLSLVDGASNPIQIELETQIIERDSLGKPKT